MNDHTLKVLEYREVLSRLAEFTQSDPGRERALAVTPRTRSDEVLAEGAFTAEALRLMEDTCPDLGQVTDTSGILDRLTAEGAVLEALQLLALAHNQKAVGNAVSALRDRGRDLPALAHLVGEMATLPQWEAWVSRSITPKGEVLDGASPELARVRKQLVACRHSVTGRLEEFMRTRAVSKVIQDQYVTLRNGRYVIPAKPEYHRAFEGVVQDTSQSGQTVFVEPLFAVGLNNSHALAQAREEEEVRRVLAAMSEGAARHRDTMALNLELLARLDLILAKARFGLRLKGIIPALDDGEAVLEEARHPLLVLEPGVSCVPIDIRIGGGTTTLVITGPNTGGKTVALKTLGLLSLMAQSGIPVPAGQGSRFRVFAGIFADIGDEQSLSQNLSTFSGHMRIIARVLEDSDARTLVLLDELGAGTDPQEGSAVSMALLEALHAKGAWSVVTTHHNLLKEFAYRAPYARNASTVFDGRTLEPTYRLRMGAPGRSHALEIARALGLDEGVVERAREMMGAGAVRVDELLGRLTDEVERETTARERAEETARGLEAERLHLRESREELERQAREEREKARREARALLREIERKGKDLLTRVEGLGKEGRPFLRKEVRRMEADVQIAFPPPPPRKDPGPVVSGDEVEVLSLDVFGRVTGLFAEGREAEVLAGGIRMRVAVENLAPVGGSGARGVAPARPGSVTYEGDAQVPSEINLLGRTVDQALESIDRFLDRSLLGPDRTLRIIHGKGTGALKRAVNRALREDPRVSAFGPAPPEQGGAGVTIVELKE